MRKSWPRAETENSIRSVASVRFRLPLVVGGVVGIAALLACTACKRAESDAHAQAAPPKPKVTVAEPVVASIEEWTEHTGRAEAVDAVDVRARVPGYLQRVAFKEGDLVQKGALLFVVDPRPAQTALAGARAELARAKVDTEFARRDTSRAEHLFATKAIAERDLDVQSTGLQQLEARVAAASAAVAAAELDLEYCYVRAPTAGRIGRILVTVGNLVGPSLASPLATLVSVDPLHVYVDVDETQALHLGRAAAAGTQLAHVGFVDEAGHPHDATIDFMDNHVDPQTGTQKVRVVVKNDDGKLSPGLFARVRLPEGGPVHDAMLVADRAVGTDQDRRFVYVVDKEDKVQYRPVKLGPLHDGLRVVREGVNASDRVVVSGIQRVRPGVVVSPEASSMNAKAGTDGAKGASK